MDFRNIEIDNNGFVTTLWLNRPEKHNALNPELMQEVISFFNSIESDNTVRIVVIRGRGKSFCAGADLQWMRDSSSLTKIENREEAKLLSGFFNSIHHSSKVVIGVAHGNIFGGGNGLLAACDMAYGLESSVFSLSETRIGMIAASITPYMLNKMNQSVYKELIFTARRFDGNEAEKNGLLNQSFSDEIVLESHLSKTLEAILLGGPNAIVGSKKLINDLIDASKAIASIADIPERLANVRVGREAQEGFNAFLEKRTPRWT